MPRAKSGSTQHNKGSRSYEDNIKTARSLREGSSVSNDSSDSDSSSSSSSAIGENFTLEDMSDDGTDAGAGPLSALELQGLLRREDHKEVTLKLRPRTVDRYFSHILAGGKLSSKGKKALRDRYLKPSLESWLLPVSMTRSFTAWRKQILVEFLKSSSPFTARSATLPRSFLRRQRHCPLSGRT